ncbi:hypothetical protein [Cohnella sp.]|uniref:hypothetical protein n=1 Tax=Cohnella sp. TaxID=1883426 RepID=UPI00356B1C3E
MLGKTIEIKLKGTPIYVYGTKAISPEEQEETLSEWVVVLDDGQIQRFHVHSRSGRVEEKTVNTPPVTLSIPHSIKPAKIQIKLGEFPPGEALRWTTPLSIRDDLQVFVERSGDVVFWNEGEITRLSVNALPDTRILVDDKERLLVLTNPTEQYQHGILGDATEAGGFVIIDANERKVIQSMMVRSPDVIESLSPLWTDWDLDGEREIVLTLSNDNTGARLALFRESGELLAEGSPIGAGHRWRHALAIAPFGPDGHIELAEVMTPHIGGTLQYVRWDKENKRLTSVASDKSFSTHDIGNRNLEMFAVTDWDQDERPELILPNQSKNELMIVKRTSEGSRTVASFDLNGRLNTNIAVLTTSNEKEAQSIVAAATKEGKFILWLN